MNNANPDLKPERVFAKDIAITRLLGQVGDVRLSFFQNDIDDVIYSQTNAYTNVRNHQNVDEVRTRGVELALNLRRLFVDGLGLYATSGGMHAACGREGLSRARPLKQLGKPRGAVQCC